MQEKGSPDPALLARLLRPAGCGPRAGIERSRKSRRKADRASSRRTGGSPPASAPAFTGALRSGIPSPALGSAGPTQGPLCSGPAVLDGSRTRPRARPGPCPSVSPGRRRGKPTWDWALPAFNRGGWKSEVAAGSPAVPPALRHPARPTHTAKVSPSPVRGSGGQRPAPGALPGTAAQRPAPSADRSGPILGRGPRWKQCGSRSSRREARSCQTNIFSNTSRSPKRPDSFRQFFSGNS